MASNRPNKYTHEKYFDNLIPPGHGKSVFLFHFNKKQAGLSIVKLASHLNQSENLVIVFK